MKKNITINLAGQLFAIDEDAYSLLYEYTETLRRYYRHQAEGEEVVDDIEVRIAELFAELVARGCHAITIAHVEEVIQRIGQLEDIASEYVAPDAESRAESSRPNGTSERQGAKAYGEGFANSLRGAWGIIRSGKHFYRDSENKMVAGVLAGMAKYFGGDPLVWRIAFLVLLIVPSELFSCLEGFSGSLFILYVIMAFIAPATSTPEDILKMRGEEVTPQNLAEEVTRQSMANNSNAVRAQRRHSMGMIFAVLLIVVSIVAWLFFVGMLCAIGAFVVAPELILKTVAGVSHDVDAAVLSQGLDAFLYLFASIAVLLFSLGYCTMHSALSLLEKVKSMSFFERLVWLFVCAVAVVGITMASVHLADTLSVFHYATFEQTSSPTVDTMLVDTVECVDLEMIDFDDDVE